MTPTLLTAYCACTLCCGPHAVGITASGVRPKQGVTVAANWLPFGTALRIQGLSGVYIVQDRYARRLSRRLDLYFTRHRDAVRWGAQRRSVTIYEPRPKPSSAR